MRMDDMERLNVKALWLMLIGSVLGALIVTLIVVCMWIGINEGMPEKIYGYAKLGKNAFLLFVWVITIMSTLIKYDRYRYVFNDEEIRVREGLWWVKTNIIPIERLHQVEMQSGPFDQMFGFAKIIVTTAGGNAVVRYIKVDKAEELVELLKKRINSYAIKGRGKNPNAFAPREVESVNSEVDVNTSETFNGESPIGINVNTDDLV